MIEPQLPKMKLTYLAGWAYSAGAAENSILAVVATHRGFFVSRLMCREWVVRKAARRSKSGFQLPALPTIGSNEKNLGGPMANESDLLDRLQSLAAANASLRQQLKQLKLERRDFLAVIADLEAIAAGYERREATWPNSLTDTQKLYQLGTLLAHIFQSPTLAPTVKEILGDTVERMARACQKQHPALIQSLEARHVFLEPRPSARLVSPLRGLHSFLLFAAPFFTQGMG